MRKVLIFGNSGSGKSTLARKIAGEEQIAHLDLDTIAWLPTTPPQRESLETSKAKLDEFTGSNNGWVIEGCYSDLLDLAVPSANEVIFLNLSVDNCIQNARNRSWEPHKYKSKEEQDSNLEMLIDWIRQYPEREDVFSLPAHQRLFDRFGGTKKMVTQNRWRRVEPAPMGK